MNPENNKIDCINHLNNIIGCLHRRNTTLKDFNFSTHFGIEEYPDGITMVKKQDGTVKVNIEIEYKVE